MLDADMRRTMALLGTRAIGELGPDAVDRTAVEPPASGE
jgi:hypothetical protein